MNLIKFNFQLIFLFFARRFLFATQKPTHYFFQIYQLKIHKFFKNMSLNEYGFTNLINIELYNERYQPKLVVYFLLNYGIVNVPLNKYLHF